MIILGAGLAGLSAAYHSEGIVYEQAGQVGGHAKSISRDGFTFDEGIHVLHTKNERVLSLLERLGVRLEIREREAWIYHHSVVTRYPFQANTYGLPVDIVKECILGFIERECSAPDKPENYEDWLYHMFGRGIAKHFMIPYATKFWGVHPRELTLEWVDVRHPGPSLEEVIEGALHDRTKGFGVNAVFHYPEGGFGAIAQALANVVGAGDRIRLNMKATTIDAKQKRVQFNNEEWVEYDQLISTIPLPDIIGLLDNVPAVVAEAATKLRYTSIMVVNLGIDRPKLTDKHWIYFPEDDFSFFRISFPMNMASGMLPPGTSSISAEIAHGNGRRLDQTSLIKRVIADLRRAGILQKHDRTIFSDIVNVKYAYVIFDQHREEAIRTIHSFLRPQGILPCGRYGHWAYLWSDEAILSGKKAVEQAKEHAGRRCGN